MNDLLQYAICSIAMNDLLQLYKNKATRSDLLRSLIDCPEQMNTIYIR